MSLAINYRHARASDVGDLRAMQAMAVRRLGADDYDTRQIESFLAHVGTMDDALVHDGTYFLAECDGRIVGCGGWSTRVPGYAKVGGHAGRPAEGQPKLRSMFVHPDLARRGIASTIMAMVEGAARLAGFDRIALTATLTGRKVYRRRGYAEHAPLDLQLPDGVLFPVVPMEKPLTGRAALFGDTNMSLRELCAESLH